MRLDKPLSPNIGAITMNFILLQKKRKGFDISPTFYLYHASSFITISHISQPYSILTLSEFGRCRAPAATIFSLITTNIIKYGEEAKFPIKKCSCNGQCNEEVGSTCRVVIIIYIYSKQIC
ncbi:unnamed protein product [Cunninghamella blakesleeana]